MRAKERRLARAREIALRRGGDPATQEGVIGDNQRQNKQFRDATNGLSKEQQRQLHDEINRHRLTFSEIKERADAMRQKGRR